MAEAKPEFKIHIKATDMEESLQVTLEFFFIKPHLHLQKKTEELAFKAFETCRQEKQLANFLKTEFDKQYGVGWNCVVGRNFGSHVVHQTKKYVYFQVRDTFVLLWKA